MTESLSKAYKPWLIASVAVLVLSLGVLAMTATLAFVLYSEKSMPLWVSLLGIASAGGVFLGFAGLAGLIIFAGWSSFREGRKVQVISPSHDEAQREPSPRK